MAWESILASVGIEIADKYKASFLTKIKLYFKSKRRVTLFGSSGSGKSQFVEALKSVNSKKSTKTFYTETTKLFLNGFPVLIHDTPGHEAAEQIRLDEQIKFVKDGFLGIINVVSYGYSEHETNLDRVFDGENFKEDFISANRVKEIEHLAKLQATIELSDIKWVITLVSKADIWWDQKNKVQKYYETGEYGEVISTFRGSFKHVVIPFSSIISPYYGIKTSGFFGEDHKLKLQNNFLRTLSNLLGKIN